MLDLLNDNSDLLTVREVPTLLQVDPSTVYPMRGRLSDAPDAPQKPRAHGGGWALGSRRRLGAGLTAAAGRWAHGGGWALGSRRRLGAGLTAAAGRCLIDPTREPRLPRRAYTGR